VRALAWDHNAHYHRLLLRQLPSPCREVLDVGCGTGAFAARLAERAEHVDALDRSPAMVAAARERVPANVTCRLADVLDADLPAGHYDAVTSISALHHVPLDLVLPRLAAALRPGGVLAAVALPRVDLPRELPVEAVAVAAEHAVGLARAGARLVRDPPPPDPAVRRMPMLDPQLTVRQVRRQAEAVLPGVRVRRLLFWRYALVWRRP
jgi:SAM-dependent methyltransferase